MKKVLLSATASTEGGFKTRVQARQFSHLLDEPTDWGGSDQGMTPVESLLASLAGCMSVGVRFYAKKFSVQIDDIQVHVDGELDPRGIMGMKGFRIGLSSIQYKFNISSSSPQENIDQLIEYAKQHCPVGDTIKGPTELVAIV